MKKKLTLIVSMCLLVLGMTACGKTDPTTVDYNGYTYDQLQSTCQNTIATLQGMSEEDKENYLNSEDEMTVNIVTRWTEATSDIGSFTGFGDFTVTKSGKTLTAEQEIIYEERPVLLTYVYTYTTMELEDVTVEAVQTLGEKMSKAGMNTIMGISVVFVVLILISLIIYCFKIIQYFENKAKNKNAVEVPQASPVVEQIAAREEQLQDDLELTAVIAAAIAAATGTTTDDFVVRSIRRR